MDRSSSNDVPENVRDSIQQGASGQSQSQASFSPTEQQHLLLNSMLLSFLTNSSTVPQQQPNLLIPMYPGMVQALPNTNGFYQPAGQGLVPALTFAPTPNQAAANTLLVTAGTMAPQQPQSQEQSDTCLATSELAQVEALIRNQPSASVVQQTETSNESGLKTATGNEHTNARLEHTSSPHPPVASTGTDPSLQSTSESRGQPSQPRSIRQSSSALLPPPIDQLSQTYQEAMIRAVLPRTHNPAPFPLVLHQILDKLAAEGRQDVASFTPDGKAFKIHNNKAFEALLPQFFRHAKLSSFKRQLSVYGFLRVPYGLNEGAFENQLFIQGRPELCQNMKRRVEKRVSSKRKRSDAALPPT